jgi:hypothetical protein
VASTVHVPLAAPNAPLLQVAEMVPLHPVGQAIELVCPLLTPGNETEPQAPVLTDFAVQGLGVQVPLTVP